MPAWLGTVAGWVIKPVLEYLGRMVAGAIANYQALKKAKEDAKNQAAQDTAKAEAVTPASNEKEVDDAINDASKHM